MRRMLVGACAAALLVAGCGGQGPLAPDDPAARSGDAAAGSPPASPSSIPAESPPDTPADTSQPPATDAPTGESGESSGGGESAGAGLVVKTASSEFGTMLFDRSGQAIYLFDKERSDRARCYGACAKAWPPVLTRGDPRARGEVRGDLLGTTRRRDGTTQVTYGGHPLYYYAHEGKNEVLCHDVTGFGGLWLVVTPGGDPAPA